jgi:P-type Ca2+ transporter type 2C
MSPAVAEPLTSNQTYAGLSSEAAAHRLASEGPNELPTARPRHVISIGVSVLREPMLLLLVAVGVTYLALGDPHEALVLVGAIAVVVGLTVYQELKTERTLAALRDLSSPRALVIRDNAPARIPGREVVRGDALVLTEGDRIAADGDVVWAANISADESLLTGESMPVPKDTGHANHVCAGTLVVSGHGIARVTETGQATRLGRIGASLSSLEIGRSLLQDEIARLVRTLAILGLGSCAVVGVLYAILRGHWLDGLLAGLTMAISMVPEEFPVVLTIFLALGAWRLSRRNVLTRRVPAIEALGAATVLCVDKTGTLTMNRMAIGTVHADGRDETFGPSLSAAGRLTIDFAALASKPAAVDPMERALAEAGSWLRIPSASQRGWTLRQAFPITADLPAVTHIWETPDSERFIGAIKGAPEAILELCGIDGPTHAALHRQIDLMARDGFRLLAVARSTTPDRGLPASPEALRWEFLGFIGLEDPVRPGVAQAIEECGAAGIRVVMLTGDYPATALHVAHEIGLTANGRILTGRDLDRMDQDELLSRASSVNVFARVFPDHKLTLVKAMQRSGEVVAMTGDGVNDSPALKAAQIGIAMGRRGTDVAREAAALVLLDDNFTSIVGAVRIGRRIYDNIRKAMSYVLAIHVPIAGVSLLPLLVGQPLVILPLHLVFLEMIVDPACSIAFEMEPEESDVMSRPPRAPSQPLFTRLLVVRSLLEGAGALVAAAAVFLGAVQYGLSEPTVRAMTFSTLVIANLALIFANRSLSGLSLRASSGTNRGLVALTTGALVTLGLVLYVQPMARLFQVAAPTGVQAAVCIAAGLTVIVWGDIVKRIVN